MITGERAARLAKRWRLEPGAPTILLPARLTGWKGQKLLITALAALRHHEAIAILAGSAQGRIRYVQELLAYARELGVADRLRLPGDVDDMPAAMMLADVVVNASIDPEAFGRTIVEAQAMGRMVIAADHGGARETIRDGETGLLFPAGDAAALAAGIDRLLDVPTDLRIGWGRHLRAMVSDHYSMAAMQDAVLHTYAELMASPRAIP
jgi:glycosyltransferase involved in cell wall biosynthesis